MFRGDSGVLSREALRLGGWPAAEYSGHGALEPTVPEAVDSLGVTPSHRSGKAGTVGSSLPPGVFTGHTRLRCAPRVALQQWSHTSQPACRGAHLCLLSPPSHALPTPQPCCPHGRCLPPGLPWDVLARPRPSITSLPAGSAHAAPAPALSPAPLTRGSPAVGLAFLGPLHLHTLGCMACSLAPMCALGPSVGLPHADWSSPSGGKGDRKEGPILMRGHRGRSAACGPGRWRLSKKRQRRKSRSGVVTVTAGLTSSQVD